MNMMLILFYIVALITLGSAVFVAVSKSLVRSIFMFFITLFGLAGLYVFALADFVAITQIVVYVGGILVLILFAFMLSGREALNRLKQQSEVIGSTKNLPSLILAVLFFVVLADVILKAAPDHLQWISNAIKHNNVFTAANTTTNNIGINLMTRYLLPFETISVLLLMVLIGAAHLARKGDKQ